MGYIINFIQSIYDILNINQVQVTNLPRTDFSHIVTNMITNSTRNQMIVFNQPKLPENSFSYIINNMIIKGQYDRAYDSNEGELISAFSLKPVNSLENYRYWKTANKCQIGVNFNLKCIRMPAAVVAEVPAAVVAEVPAAVVAEVPAAVVANTNINQKVSISEVIEATRSLKIIKTTKFEDMYIPDVNSDIKDLLAFSLERFPCMSMNYVDSFFKPGVIDVEAKLYPICKILIDISNLHTDFITKNPYILDLRNNFLLNGSEACKELYELRMPSNLFHNVILHHNEINPTGNGIYTANMTAEVLADAALNISATIVGQGPTDEANLIMDKLRFQNRDMLNDLSKKYLSNIKNLSLIEARLVEAKLLNPVKSTILHLRALELTSHYLCQVCSVHLVKLKDYL